MSYNINHPFVLQTCPQFIEPLLQFSFEINGTKGGILFLPGLNGFNGIQISTSNQYGSLQQPQV